MTSGPPSSPTAERLRSARVAVSVLFVANAVVGAAWLPRLSQVQERLGLSDGELGLALAVGAAGGLAVGPAAGPLAARLGTGRLSVVAMCAFAPLTFLPGVAASWWLLAAALFWFGPATPSWTRP
jgi:MFS family permease